MSAAGCANEKLRYGGLGDWTALPDHPGSPASFFIIGKSLT